MAAPLLAAVLLWQGADQSLAGHWTNASGSVVVLVAPCAAEGWCATVEWASDKATADAARAGTPTLVGTEIMQGFIPIEANRWKGRLFVPDLNKRSTAELRLLDGDRLRIRGCTIGGLVCKSQVWTRSQPK